MLRGVLLAFGVVALGGAAVMAAWCWALLPLCFWLAFWGIVLVAGILFERGRYKPPTQATPGPGWLATEERFVDLQTGERVTVYYRPSTGERRYVGG